MLTILRLLYCHTMDHLNDWNELPILILLIRQTLSDVLEGCQDAQHGEVGRYCIILTPVGLAKKVAFVHL